MSAEVAELASGREPALAPRYVVPEDLPSRPILAVARMEQLPPTEAYFDDTGCNSAKNDVFMFVGVLGLQPNWTAFSREWRSVRTAPPSLEYWHTTDVRARIAGKVTESIFDALSADELKAKDEALAKVIANHAEQLRVICIRLPHVYHQKYVKGQIAFGSHYTKREKKQRHVSWDHPHSLCFADATMTALNILKGWGIQSKLNYFFEAQEAHPYQASMHDTWRGATGTMPREFASFVGDLTFCPGKTGDICPLEAADMVAWHLQNRSRRTGTDDPLWQYISAPIYHERTITVRDLQREVERGRVYQERLLRIIGEGGESSMPSIRG